jgi:hypothetical protein
MQDKLIDPVLEGGCSQNEEFWGVFCGFHLLKTSLPDFRIGSKLIVY